jgi:DnaJ-class molecular chaperone
MTDPDHYSILGISKGASDDEIKSAYRKLARTHHPDKGGDKERFQKIQQAYETLSDKDKRQQYDNPHQPNNDIFNQFFGMNNMNNHFQTQNRRVQKNHHYYTCKISLRDVYFGIKKKFKVQRSRICAVCKSNCNTCGGSGHVTKHIQMGPFTQIVHQSCGVCNGVGIVKNDNGCNDCKNGYINEQTVFEVNMQKGIKSGTNFIFDGWGEQAVHDNEESGSFIVNVVVEDHPDFTRMDNNLIYNVNISLRESITGKLIKIPHFDGEIDVYTKGFGIINPEREYILFGKGIQTENVNGNLHLRFKINYKEMSFIDSDLDKLNAIFDEVGFN